jgi:hypothetical protein
MDTSEQAQPSAAAAATTPMKAGRRIHWPTLVLLSAALTAASASLVVYSLSGPDGKPAEKEQANGSAWVWHEVFPNWPKDQKPELVIVLTGQTYGYLQKCGCSNPQKGGLERRHNFIAGFKTHGVEVVPLDLGDVASQLSHDHKLLHSQALLKYGTAMRAMKAIGYRNVGLGLEEFSLGLLEAIGEFSLQNGNEQPGLLAANLAGTTAQDAKGKQIILPKKIAFPNAKGNDSAIGDWNVISTKSKLTLGVVGIVGDPTIASVKTIDSKMAFAPNSAAIVAGALKNMSKQTSKPNLNVLLYAGPNDLAAKAAKMFPQFGIVVCSSAESEPPSQPTPIKDSLLLQVGHKGQNVGVVGVFRNKAGGLDLRYQLVSMTPNFETPADPNLEAANPALHELERYSKLVRDRGYLVQNPRGPHPLQVSNKSAKYVGSQACAACHDTMVPGDSWAVHAASKHANAYAALVAARKPSLRQFDGECIRCHTVGYNFNTGFVDAKKTPQLMNVGCENCHGPGSEHAANPKNKKLALELSPWKVNPADKMPTVQQIKAYLEEKNDAKRQAIFTQQQVQTMNRVDRICQQCHNAENDPHFKIEEFWPKIAHSKNPANGNAPKKGPAIAPPMDSGPVLTPPK